MTRINDGTGKMVTTASGASGSSNIGWYREKNWSGTNTATPLKTTRGKKRYYTTLDAKGRRVTRSFYEKPLRAEKWREPQPYTITVAKYLYSPLGSFLTQTVRASDMSLQSEQYYWDCSCDGAGLITTLPALPTWTANDDIKLIGKLREAVYGSDFNASVFLGEANQTLRMIGDSATKVARAYHLARKGDVWGAAKTLGTARRFPPKTKRQDLGSAWLELQYGWLPLLKDVKGGAELLSHQLHLRHRLRFKVRSVLENVQPDVGGGYYQWQDRKATIKKQIIAWFSEPPSVAALSGILDPELVAWELVPFSFVADWVAPIGSYLEARAFTGRMVGTFVTTTVNRQHIGGLKSKPYSTGTGQGTTLFEFSASSGGYENNTVSMTRIISSTLSVPAPVVKPWTKIASWQHCANAIALLAGIKPFKETTLKKLRNPLDLPYTE